MRQRRASGPRLLAGAAIVVAAMAVPGQAQTGDAFLRVPTQEIPGKQVGWFVNRTFDAFVKAVENERPLIMVFGSAESPFTRKFAERVTPCPHLNQLAGVAVFAYGSPLVDEEARRMAVHLKVTDYPTISVIAPRTEQLTELYRMEGFFDAATVASDVVKLLNQRGYWPKNRPQPPVLPTSYLLYPNLACTPEGAKRLGL